MKIAPFSLEQYFARYEFSVPYNLCASDCETVTIGELLAMADVGPDDLLQLRLGYTDSQGHAELRAAVAALYTNVEPDEIVFLAAPEEGIYLTMRTLLQPEDEVVVLSPSYDSLRNLPEHICGPERVHTWEITAGPNGWQLDLDQLESFLTPRTRLLVINFPHNPTGYLPAEAFLRTIVDVVRRRNIWLLSDEMYRGLELGGVPPLPSVADLYERSITLAGLSKVHGLPGLRAGWLVIHDPAVREQLINWKHYTTICAPAPSELLALAALAAREPLIARNRGIIERNLDAADPFFERWSSLFLWRPPQAGSVALVGLNRPSALAYCGDLAETAGVLLLPGSFLGSDDRHVRFGFGRADFAHNLRQFEAHLVETEDVAIHGQNR